MDFKEYLMGLEWNSFATYPEQGANIYLHCYAYNEDIHKFFKIQNFNTVSFDPRTFLEKLNLHNLQWHFTWLPCESINEIL